LVAEYKKYRTVRVTDYTISLYKLIREKIYKKKIEIYKQTGKREDYILGYLGFNISI